MSRTLLRSLLTPCLAAVVLNGGGASGGGASASTIQPPRFEFSSPSAIAGDNVLLTLVRPPRASGVLRVFLVQSTVASTVHSRFDPRLSFIGFVPHNRTARLLFTVPQLQVGTYQLAYWCRRCFSRGKALAIVRSPRLDIAAPVDNGCPSTTPNRNAPSIGAPQAANFHGDGRLWVLLPADGMLRFAPSPDDTLFEKMLWVGRRTNTELEVEYRRLDVPSPPRSAVTILGRLSGYDGPSWASRMYFQPGCWFVSGHTENASLSVILLVLQQ